MQMHTGIVHTQAALQSLCGAKRGIILGFFVSFFSSLYLLYSSLFFLVWLSRAILSLLLLSSGGSLSNPFEMTYCIVLYRQCHHLF